PVAREAAGRRLRAALEAPRLRLLTQFNALPDGVKFLVDMRAEILALLRADPGLAPLEADLKSLLVSWFDVGFLELRRLTWRTPALVLEKIMLYEAVHAIRSWDDLKNRLDSDRRLYAYFHPRMPDEPLIFVEVALVRGIAGNIQALLDLAAPVDDPARADTAIFYSISNAQKGLAGISFGNFLIKRVVDSLAGEFKNLKTFATLSPVPGFRAWLDERLAEGEPGLLTAAEHRLLTKAARQRGAKGSLKTLLATPDWHRDDDLKSALEGPLVRLCARYLAEAKRNNGDGRALDPVAHFHLSNGARIERIDWLGDVSPKGIAQSAGLMVNYLYKLTEIDQNHETYSGAGRVVVSPAIRALLKG
ncbi:MAG: malonyl-CoA decarboxylase, partial [Alphaproteobacteria bacterium]|nr:malonyl-CoA decarboxylase [Alphaproteobacteria bacterium]